jgi:NAD(P)-dependent dehydrogenase (short-subunit alcohol dehydrogenase family)
VIGFYESIRAELEVMGHKHVRSTIVCPSYIGTGMFEAADTSMAGWTGHDECAATDVDTRMSGSVGQNS